MKKYRMPYQTFECAHTRVIRATKPKEFLDPEYYVRAHFKMASDGTGPFMLNAAARRALERDGPFRPPFYLAEKELIDIYRGHEAFIFCPGTSLEGFDFPERPRRWRPNCVVLAVNSAGFVKEVREMYWIISESGYMRWLLRGRRWQWENRAFVITGRCAIFMRKAKVKVNRVYVSRWEEEFIVPPRTPAVTISNALVTAWEMGCTTAYVVGADQSYDNQGKAYAKGLPHTPKGATMGFEDQLRALVQFQLPDFKIYNGSPKSKESLPWEYLPYEEISNRLRQYYEKA
ncbi:MAG: hypothetical protein JSW58_08260 [Candidatus Latescibacterota bacterium]|nr:MAG: hypothetical protein JSW58_08260 [Candidatus Latescibacterota bacterium]